LDYLKIVRGNGAELEDGKALFSGSDSRFPNRTSKSLRSRRRAQSKVLIFRIATKLHRKPDVSFELPAMRIRPCLRSDLQAVRAIEEACYGVADAFPLIALTQFLELCGGGFVVCEIESLLAGFAIAGTALEDRELGWVLNVAVAPGFQGRRIGPALCENLLSVHSRKGVRRVRATVAPDNARSLKMLQGLGFVMIDNLPDYFGSGQSRLLMERSISGIK
jgi:ribosomal-protein-alanine N-acetyltransferase